MVQSFGTYTADDEVVAVFSELVKGRTFLITGPTPTGLGAATAYALARAHPACIILVGRSPEKYTETAEKIRTIEGRHRRPRLRHRPRRHRFHKDGARKIASEFDHIDVLINNAGVAGLPYKKTKDGIEEHFATNHIGHFLLTNILIPTVLKSTEPTVITLTSGAHVLGTGGLQANVHFTQALAKKLGSRGLVALTLHPGVTWSTSLLSPLSYEDEKQLRELASKVPPKTVEQGCSTTLVAALDRELGLRNNGGYLADCQVSQTQGTGVNVEGAPEKLWELSESLVGERFTY